MEINGKLRDTELIKRNGIQNVIRITGVHHDSSRACKTSAKKTRKRIKREDNSGIECKMQDAQWNNNQQFNKGTEQKQGEYAWDAVSLKKRTEDQRFSKVDEVKEKMSPRYIPCCSSFSILRRCTLSLQCIFTAWVITALILHAFYSLHPSLRWSTRRRGYQECSKHHPLIPYFTTMMCSIPCRIPSSLSSFSIFLWIIICNNTTKAVSDRDSFP